MRHGLRAVPDGAVCAGGGGAAVRSSAVLGDEGCAGRDQRVKVHCIGYESGVYWILCLLTLVDSWG